MKGPRLLIPLFLLVALGIACAITVSRIPIPEELSHREGVSSIRVLDRDGFLLREVRADDGARARWMPLEQMGRSLPRALLAAEDRRFYSHFGADPLALLRAAWLNVRAGHVVSGGSTLTMQLARTLRPHPRTLAGKISEIGLALRLEASLSKSRILEEYLNRVSFGPNLRGAAVASFAYLDKAPGELSRGEAALVAGIARGPTLYALTRRTDLARKRRDRILERMARAGDLSREEAVRGENEPISSRFQSPRWGAPHFVEALVGGRLGDWQPEIRALLAQSPTKIDSSIDGALQREAEVAVHAAVHALLPKQIRAAAAIVLDNRTNEVLAYVGSPDFFDAANLGQNDGVRSLRQPGSTLKPFLYELAFERLGYAPSTLLADLELHLDADGVDYAPQNYDGKFRGPVRLREALGNSLNVPAIRTAVQLGTAPLLERLRALGFRSLTRDAEYYGPALALGDGEITLLDLANAYAILARGGIARNVSFLRGVGWLATDDERRMPEAFAAQVTDILKDRTARSGSFGTRTELDFDFDVAAKTGTSKGYRDNWTAGYSSTVTVAVWVGNFDGSAMQRVSGITGAAPLFHAIMEAAMRTRPAGPLPIARSAAPFGGLAELERVEVCALSGGRRTQACPSHLSEWLTRGQRDNLPVCEFHIRLSIDRRNGLRAGSDCPSSFTSERVFERFPAMYDHWVEQSGRPRPPEDDSPNCPLPEPIPERANDLTDASRALQILDPIDGAHLVLDPDRPRTLQSLRVRVTAPAGVKRIDLSVDGAPWLSSPPPFNFAWPLLEGDHELRATVAVAVPGAGNPRSTSIRIHVRAPVPLQSGK